jgi:eukaryotic-like serine/threonine-protein kinase
MIVGAAFVVVALTLTGGLILSPGQESHSLSSAPVSIAVSFHSSAVAISAPLNARYDWPELHANPQLRGLTLNSTITPANAPTLGLGWSTNLYGSVLDSPAVAYDPVAHAVFAYVGTEAGNVLAVNVSNGQIAWSDWFGSIVRSSPLFWNDSVYVATLTNPTIFRLNATTGAVQASQISPDPIEATPTLATPPGGVPTLYIGSLDVRANSAPFIALNAVNLSVEWEFSKYNSSTFGYTAGSWDSASYVVSASGTPMVIFGTDNPDSSVYDLNALTGKLIWRFQCYEPNLGDWDVAAGAAISPPGMNGFSQGVVYAVNKISRVYALDLNNGTLRWETNLLNAPVNATGLTRSTPALVGENLVLGYGNGLVNLNASTGAVTWVYRDPTNTESIASPAVIAGTGHGVIVTGDVAGYVDVVSMAHGTQLYTYATGAYFTSSPALFDGNILIAPSNGFLDDFVTGGGNTATLPTTSISYPSGGANLTYPNANVVLQGNATSPAAVSEVEVAIQSGGPSGVWWDAATSSWSPGPVNNLANLVSTGASRTSWSLSFPVPTSGATYEAYANAVSSSGQTDILGAQSSFTVGYSTSGPHIEVAPEYVAPGGTTYVKGGGFGMSTNVDIEVAGKVLTTVKSLSTGALPYSPVIIPTTSGFGLTALTALSTVNASRTATAGIVVSNSWNQTGAGPGHPGYEPNDLTFNYLTYPGNGSWVSLAWHFDPGVAFEASPVVAGGVAYLADTAGHLYAVDIKNGGLLWTYSLASGKAVNGSPAVDPAKGLVIFGATDGSLDAVWTATGTSAWSIPLGAAVSAPALANGRVFVTTLGGHVEAIDESNGTVAWSVGLASGSITAPSLNTTANLLVAAELNGDVVGLNDSTGAVLWTYLAGGSVRDAAVISGGFVYFGSNNGDEYALSQTSGGLKWKYDTGSAVEDSAALCFNRCGGGITLNVGSNNGHVYSLDAATGVEVFNVSTPSAIVGVSAAAGILIFENAQGRVSSARGYPAVDAVFWHYATLAALDTTPVLVDGTIYVAAEDGNLYAFTPYGNPPD